MSNEITNIREAQTALSKVSNAEITKIEPNKLQAKYAGRVFTLATVSGIITTVAAAAISAYALAIAGLAIMSLGLLGLRVAHVNSFSFAFKSLTTELTKKFEELFARNKQYEGQVEGNKEFLEKVQGEMTLKIQAFNELKYEATNLRKQTLEQQGKIDFLEKAVNDKDKLLEYQRADITRLNEENTLLKQQLEKKSLLIGIDELKDTNIDIQLSPSAQNIIKQSIKRRDEVVNLTEKLTNLARSPDTITIEELPIGEENLIEKISVNVELDKIEEEQANRHISENSSGFSTPVHHDLEETEEQQMDEKADSDEEITPPSTPILALNIHLKEKESLSNTSTPTKVHFENLHRKFKEQSDSIDIDFLETPAKEKKDEYESENEEEFSDDEQVAEFNLSKVLEEAPIETVE